MLELKFKSEGLPSDKPRVYFTCHPDDFDRSFSEVTADILRLSNCAIYYTGDMTQPISAEDRAHQLYRMSLFVVPVTLKLLIEPNRAMDEDVPYALSRNIPLLPIMLEPGLDPVYSRENKFSDRKYLMPSRDTDGSGLSYEDKLKRFLNSVLWDAETAKRIRAAFDCTVFLSYRWKDRYHADDLIRLIHKNPFFRDVATWYDEYLVPGEGFNAAIAEALDRSKLYAMVVTDNLVTEKNYIQTDEYPTARNLGISILPADMGISDENRVKLKVFDGIPECVSTKDESLFYATAQELLHNAEVALCRKKGDPEHDFLIGLAYLEGIDVEVDRNRALCLITSSARAGCLPAIEKLHEMYLHGNGVSLNLDKAMFWVEELYSRSKTGPCADLSAALRALKGKADLLKLGGVPLAARTKTLNEIYELSCEVLGKENPDTVVALSNLAASQSSYPAPKRVIKMQEEAFEFSKKHFAENDQRALCILHNWAIIYKVSMDLEKAVEYQQRVYELQCLAEGENSAGALTELFSLALCQTKLRNFVEAKLLLNKAFDQANQIYGERHPSLIPILTTLVYVCDSISGKDEALKYEERAFELARCLWGNSNLATISAQTDLAISCAELGYFERALELQEEAYSLMKKMRFDGEKLHSSIGEPLMFTAIENLAEINSKLGRYDKALDLYEKLYQQRRFVNDDDTPSSIQALGKMALTYEKMGDQEKAAKLLEHVCSLCKKPYDPYPHLLRYANAQLLRIRQGFAERADESNAYGSKADWFESAPFSSHKQFRRITPVTLYD